VLKPWATPAAGWTAGCNDVDVALPFPVSDAVLLGAQASLVALPSALPPPALRRLSGRAWALVPAASIAGVIAAIALAPGTANLLTWLALVTTPLLAAPALAVVVPRARAAWALAVPALLALAWAAQGSLSGDAAALALTGLACLTLGWLLAAVAPTRWLKLGIVAMAAVDSILVFGHLLQGPNATLNAAVPAPGLPQLQFVSFGSAVMGYGDLFIAGVLGGVLLLERRARAPVALACLVLAGAFDLLFFVTDELPATVPVAAALVVSEAWRRVSLATGGAAAGPRSQRATWPRAPHLRPRSERPRATAHR
jgi:hypothetical protein